MKLLNLTLAAALALGGTTAAMAQEDPAQAEAQVEVNVGDTVYGPQGQPVGTIESVANGQAILDTGEYRVPLTMDMFAQGENGPVIGATKDQVNQIMAQQEADRMAKRDAALIVGSNLTTSDNRPVGEITEVDEDYITFDYDGQPVRLERDVFGATPAGAPMLLYTSAQFDELMAGAGGTDSDATAEATETPDADGEE